MEKIIVNKTAIVSGGSYEIGKASAFGARDANVVIADVQDGTAIAEQIKSNGGKAISMNCAVSGSADVKALVEKTVDEFSGWVV